MAYSRTSSNDEDPWSIDIDDDEDGEATEGNFQSSGRTALLVIISAHPNMFRPWEDSDDTPVRAALKCCESMWRTKVISSPNDKAAIVFMGTEQKNQVKLSTDEIVEMDNFFTLQELDTITAGRIKALRKIIASSDLGGFDESIGCQETYKLDHAFRLAKIFFEQQGLATYSKKIMLFTADDNPHRDNPDLRTTILQKASDLGKVDMDVICFSPNFDESKIYKDIVQDDANILKTHDLSDLLKVVRIKQRMKRPYVRPELEIAPGLSVGVGVYTFVRKAQKPKKEKIYAEQNPLRIQQNPQQPGKTEIQVAHRNVSVFNANTGVPVLKSDVVKTVTVSGQTVTLDADERRSLKYDYPTGIRILGYIDANAFDHYLWHRANPYFVYPDESSITGSTSLFAALLRRCYALKKVALVRFVLTRSNSPQLGCLVPSLETKYLAGGLAFPQGFHLTVLPFADEIRHHEYEGMEPIPTITDIMKQVVRKLTNKVFTPLDVKNPNLYNLWRHIESYALEIPVEEEEEFVDMTKPDMKQINSRLGDLPIQLSEVVAARGLTYEAPKGRTSKPPTKAPKLDFDMRNEWKHNRLSKLTVAVLREFCEKNGIQIGTDRKKHAKGFLIDKIDAFFKRSASNGA